MRFNTANRVAFACLTAATVGTLAPDVASAATTAREAETMEYGVVDPVSGNVWPQESTEQSPSGGTSVYYGPNGTAAVTVDLPTRLTGITVRARGDQCQGAPQAKVSVDGNVVGTFSVSSTTWADHRQALSLPAGSHRVVVSFDNNYYGGGCNRNLYVDRIALDSEDAPTASVGNVIWAGDGEKPLADEWSSGNAFDVNSSQGTYTTSSLFGSSTRIRQVTSPVAQGTRAYAMTVGGGDRDAYTSGAQRTELGQNNGARTMPDGVNRQMYQGQERWLALQIRVSPNYPSASWNSLVQLKGEGTGNGPLSLYWENGRLMLKKSASQSYGSTNISTVWSPPSATPRDQWLKVLLHVKWSTSGDGFYEFFGDLADGQGFRQLKGRTDGWTLKHSSSGGPVAVGARFGIYRSGLTSTDTAYFDGFNVAATRADATARAFGRSM